MFALALLAAGAEKGSEPVDGQGSAADFEFLLPFLGGSGLGGGPLDPFFGGSSGAGDSDRVPNGSALEKGSPLVFCEGKEKIMEQKTKTGEDSHRRN